MRRPTTLLVIVALALALLASGCAKKPAATGDGAVAATEEVTVTFPLSVTDDQSRTVTIDEQPQRIVSLAPADTEIAAALGLLPNLVGVTTYDDYPEEVKALPKVGDFTAPNLEAIAAAKPDLVLVTGGVQQDVVEKLEGLGAKVIVVDPSTIEETEEAILTVGRATGRSAEAKTVVAGIERDVEAVRAKVAGSEQVSCFVEIAQNPLYTAGADTLIDDMVRIAGGRNVVTRGGYLGYSLEQLLKDDPQVYMVTRGSMNDPSGLVKRPGYDKLAAVTANRVTVLDDNLVSRPGPRVAQGLRQIAEALHPDAFR